MACSLVCSDCKKILTSLTEAQDHSEITGHVNFEESKEEVKLMVCKDCGKPCRSQAERDLHTKFTGHASYDEKVGATIDTEASAKALREAAKDNDDEGAPGGSTAEPMEVDMVPAVVDEALLKEMEEMGFPTNRAVRALHFSAGGGLDGALNWIVEHDSDPDIDQPLLVPKPQESKESGPPLSAAEARKKAEELVRKAKERREKEEREQALLREKERIRMGKEMAAAKRKEDEMALKRMVEAREREKREEAAAKEKLRKKLEEDRKERRRRLGLPEELTEEEKAKEAERLAREAEAEKARHLPVAIKPVSVIEKLRGILVSMKKAHTGGPADEEKWKTAAITLSKYLANIAKSPDEEKFRAIKLSNAAFQQRVACVPGGVDFLKLCGFQEKDETLTLQRQDVNLDLLNGAGAEIQNAVSNPFFGVL